MHWVVPWYLWHDWCIHDIGSVNNDVISIDIHFFIRDVHFFVSTHSLYTHIHVMRCAHSLTHIIRSAHSLTHSHISSDLLTHSTHISMSAHSLTHAVHMSINHWNRVTKHMHTWYGVTDLTYHLHSHQPYARMIYRYLEWWIMCTHDMHSPTKRTMCRVTNHMHVWCMDKYSHEPYSHMI